MTFAACQLQRAMFTYVCMCLYVPHAREAVARNRACPCVYVPCVCEFNSESSHVCVSSKRTGTTPYNPQPTRHTQKAGPARPAGRRAPGPALTLFVVSVSRHSAARTRASELRSPTVQNSSLQTRVSLGGAGACALGRAGGVALGRAGPGGVARGCGAGRAPAVCKSTTKMI